MSEQEAAIDIGSRLELLLDDYLIERFAGGARLELHQPTPREVVFTTDRPWEGNMCGYITVLEDSQSEGGRFRMFYKTWRFDIAAGEGEGTHPMNVALALSDDGIHWRRPVIGRHDIDGARDNNIVYTGFGKDAYGTHGFAPFLDTNPACHPKARYKAMGAGRHATAHGLYGMASPDGIEWSLVKDSPIITAGAFDSQNLAFYDTERGEYRAYVRDFRDGTRDIKTCTSRDFLNWTQPQWLAYPGAPNEQLYTNQVMPYPRAPHLFIGFPTRYVERGWSQPMEALPELEHRRLRAGLSRRFGTALTDGLFMSSRDGQTFRRWGEAFLRPGFRPLGNWTYGDNYQAWGLLETRADVPGGPPEWSLYATEWYWRNEGVQFRRYTLRLDGFVSVNAPLAGGEIITRPMCFDGDRLTLNVSTSAAGFVQVELQDASGAALKGHSLQECPPIFGDTIAHVVHWEGGPDVSRWRGQPVRVRMVLHDADVYALQFSRG